MSESFQLPPGMIAATTHGTVQAETMGCMLESRSHLEAQGIRNIQWTQIHGALVDKARNEAMRGMLRSAAQWVLFLDMDMVWEPPAILQLLQTAYGSHPKFDVLGAYCNLRGGVGLPTIDTGTGTWESWFPGQGVVDVMRTGAAFMLVKRRVAEVVPDPWFALRVPMRPLDAVAEVDNFCHTIFDGRNPFRGLPGTPWERLVEAVAHHASTQEVPWVAAEVGEDSSFCDRVKAAGLSIGVHTDIQVKHLSKIVQDAAFHREKMDANDRNLALMSGLVD